MFKKSLLTALLMAAVSQAAVKELIPHLASDNLETQTQARLELLAACSQASAPDAADGAREAICREMCALLAGDYPVVSVVLPVLDNLGRIAGEESVDTLEQLLAHPDEHIRDAARRALSANPSPKAGQVLGAQLMMRNPRDARTTAGLIVALGERRQAGASKLIADDLGSADEVVFIAAVKALGLLNEDAGVRALAEVRAKEQGFRLAEVNAALFSTDRTAVFEKLYAEKEPIEVRAVALLGLAMNNGMNVAADALASGPVALQAAVIEAAVQRKQPELYRLVATRLETLSPALQPQALGALEFSGSSAYAASVEPLLKSDNVLVQDCASSALARIGTAASIPALMDNGRPEALRALGVMNAEGVDRALEKIAASKDDAASAAAIEALAIRGRRDLVPAFFTYADGKGRAAPKAAVEAIGQVGDIAVLEQLAGLMMAKEASPLSRDVLNTIVAIMRRSSDPAKAVDILVAQMSGASPRSQANILQALVQTGSQEALKPLADACRSNDESLQKLAVKLLAGWKSADGIPTMLELAGEETMSMPNHVNLMRGVSRLLAAQRRVDKTLAKQALDTCRRAEEVEMFQAILEKKK
ncbi:HEAT repeat domain-containing protein [Pontiella sp.]|uniref:HEAT repeat domain-containing protein n=2 Tax=Pontiella sp. TaxID=2837462 RepID=UPI0035614B47